MEERRQDLAEIAQKPKHLFRDSILILIFGTLLFAIGTYHQEFINFESRFALFAQNMMQTGPTFFPTIFGVPYPDYPATSTFLIYLCSLPFGQVIKLSAVLPSAIAAALSMMFVYLTMAPHSRKWGFCSVLFMVFTVAFFTHARSISLDMYTTAVASFCFYAVYARDSYQTKQLTYWVPLALIIGFLCRGPIGFVIPSGVVFGYFLISARWKRLIIFSVSAAILLCLLVWLLLGLAHHIGGLSFMRHVILMQVTGRMNPGDAEPFSFYWSRSLGNYALSFPFAIIVIIGLLPQLFKRYPNRHIKLLQYLIVATLIIIIGMSIPGGKKTRYIMAITPFCSIIAAYLFVAKDQTAWLRGFRHFFTFLFFFFPFICATLTLLARNYAYHKGIHLNDSIDYNTLFILLAIIQIIALVYALTLKNYSKKEVIALTVGTLSFALIIIMVVEPAELTLNAARPFVEKVETLRASKPGPLYFYQIDPDGSAIKYLVNANLKHEPHYIQSEQQLMSVPKNAYVIIENDDYQKLSNKTQSQFNTLVAGNFGRDEDLALQRD